ncbi:MAG: hypothetical protein L3J52_10765 [Proteobacteria bacterium]|nr:hypothetical protein [Pseudomonadota bacterium]
MNIIPIVLMLISQAAMSEIPPSSMRSKKAIESLTPQLISDFEGLDLKLGNPIFIRIFKQEAELEIWVEKDDDSFKLFKTYPICTFGNGGLGPKLAEGDGKAPEGFYYEKPTK